ncbi:MAG: T9SS type A sorting domain-containing protein [Bacteroidota bacterium]|nr:T9SS type A sorting domain-containing protein [Bacteroidota bacterium]
MQLNYELSEGEIGVVNIMDVAGKLVASYVLANTENILQINAGDLNNGVYL